MSSWQKLLKRAFDITLSFFLLLLFCIPLCLLIVLATISTNRFGLFSQERIGYRGEVFTIYKLRTMLGDPPHDLNEWSDHVTRFGRWLRNTKLDELPQLYNILVGDMSFVGPRPDVPGYADKLVGEDRKILEVRPGITGPATLKYKEEEDLLAMQQDPLLYNDTVIWPDKVAINRQYVEEWSFWKDVGYMWKTIF
ncbi:sugar transferase [Sungkyunkwania multivorans]|uniref:Sugar transferase n=1 Tax=Sungkyunkwania multivorans TaxID=1173618 RepID=A0ABW3D3F0_9FLAO